MIGQKDLPPGYRFSPTDEELVVHYLKNRACGKDFHQGVITEVDIYKHEPRDLAVISAVQSLDPVWYFFNAQDKKHSHSARINRTTSKGYWKATGKDRKICSGPHAVGIKKTLIYYEGRAPSGKRTDWIMHEYKLDEQFEKRCKAVCSIALCRIRKKGGPGPRNGEQYGAAVFDENNEWWKDVEDDIDEKPLIPSETRYTLSMSSAPNQIKELKVQGEMALPELQPEGSGSNFFPSAEGLDTDMFAFLESFLCNDKEATSLEAEMVSSHPVLDKSFADLQHSDCGNNSVLYDLEDIQTFFDQDVHDILHPTAGEEQILGELFHLADGGPLHLHANNMECNAISQLPASSDGSVACGSSTLYNDDVGPSGVVGDFIELADMNAPLDGFVPLQASSHVTKEELKLPFGFFGGGEYIGGSPDILHTQGTAPRRAKLQIAPPSADRMHANMLQQIKAMPNLHSKVLCQEGSRDVNIQILDGSITSLSSGSNSGSDEISNVIESSPKSHVSKHVSPYTVTKCEEVPAQVFFIATTNSQGDESSIKDGKNVRAASCRQQHSSRGMQAQRTDREAGLESRSGPILNTNNCAQEAGVDCETGLNSTVEGGAEAIHLVMSSSHGNNVIGELVSKVKSLTLRSGFVQIESNLSTTFNDKVFALGKPVAQLVPSKDYVNPYRSLRRGIMAALCRLVIAVLFLFFIFLGIHMLTKYVVWMVA